MNETVKYLVTRTLRGMTKSGARVTLRAGEIARDLTDAALEDALARGWIEKRVTRDGVLVDPDGEAKPEVPAPIGKNPATLVTRTNENLEIDALKSLDEAALVTACAERALPADAAQALVAFLRESGDSKAAALEYLAADFSQRKELCENLLSLDAEKRAAEADMRKAEAAAADATADPGAKEKGRETVVVDGEEVERPKDMTGGSHHAPAKE